MKTFALALLCLGMLVGSASFVSAEARYSPKIPVQTKPANFDLYQERITTPAHLDWLWQAYLQGGEKRALAKILTALDLNTFSGALKKAKESQKTRALTEAEKQAVLLDGVFQAALWSLESNARQRPEVAADLKSLEKEQRSQSISASHGYLLLVLSRVAPDEYRFSEQTDGFTVSTPSGPVRFTRKP